MFSVALFLAPPALAEPSPSPSPSAPVSSPDPVQSMPAADCSLCGLKLHFSGMADAYYAYNFNSPAPTTVSTNYGSAPAGQNNFVVPNTYHDQVVLNMVKLIVDRSADPFGIHFDLAFGPWPDLVAGNVNNPANLSDSSTRNVMQAYLIYNSSFGLNVIAGKFYTDMGYESVDPQLNMNYSQTYLFKYITPWWHTGVRATYKLSDKLSVSGGFYNGNNTYYENNRIKNYEGRIEWTPFSSFKMAATYLVGTDPVYGAGGLLGASSRNIAEAYSELRLTKALNFAVDWAQSSEVFNGGPSQQASSVAAFAGWNFLDRWYLFPRYEVFTDGGVTFATGNPQTINVITGAVEYRPTDTVRLQGEFRNDSSNNATYVTNGTSSKSQSMVTLAVMLRF